MNTAETMNVMERLTVLERTVAVQASLIDELLAERRARETPVAGAPRVGTPSVSLRGA